jgi:GAF domain-containing protein
VAERQQVSKQHQESHLPQWEQFELVARVVQQPQPVAVPEPEQPPPFVDELVLL